MANKTDLESRIAAYMHRTNFSAVLLTEFIDDGMEFLAQTMRVAENELTAIETPVAGVITLPLDFRMMRTVTRPQGNGTILLKPLTPLNAQRWSVPATNSLGYVIEDKELTLYPASDVDHTLDYWAAGDPLVVGADENVFSVGYPEISMYAALVPAAIFTQDFNLADRYQARLQGLIDIANAAGRDSRMPVGSSVGIASVSGAHPVRTM